MSEELKQYTKKPVTITAIQFTKETLRQCMDFLGHDLKEWDEDELIIRTLEGSHRASIGDYIIRGVKGEHYPCKPDIFAMTYVAAGDSRPAPVQVPERMPTLTAAERNALERFVECCEDPDAGGHDVSDKDMQRLRAIGAVTQKGRVWWVTEFGDWLLDSAAPSASAGRESGAQESELRYEIELLDGTLTHITCYGSERDMKRLRSRLEYLHNREAELRTILSTPPAAVAVPDAINAIVRDVAELPDRTSPEDWPDAMLVTAGELARILRNRLAAAPSAPVAREEELACDDCGAVTPDPWHSSKGDRRHYHRCDACHAKAVAREEGKAVDAEKVMALVNEYGYARWEQGDNFAREGCRPASDECRIEAEAIRDRIRAMLTPAIANQEAQDGR